MRDFILSELLKEAIQSIRDTIDVDAVIGTPIKADEITIIPVNKLTLGLVTGGGGIPIKGAKVGDDQEKPPLGLVGGGVTVMPVGFLSVMGDEVSLIKMQGDNGDKWLDILQAAIKKAMR